MIILNTFVNDMRVIKEASTLAQQDIEVAVLAVHEEGLAREESLCGFTVHRMASKGLRLFTKRPLPLTRYFGLVLKGVCLGVRMRADVYHCHDLKALPIGYLICRFRRAKLIYDSHELWSDSAYRLAHSRVRFWLARKVEHFLVRRVDSIITVSNSIADYIVQQDGTARPIVIRNVPYLQKIQRTNLLRESLGLVADERKIVLYQGGIFQGRGLAEVIRAMEHVENAILILMGDGPLREPLKGLCHELQLSDRVFFHEAVPPQELLRYTAGADVGVAPTQNVSLSYYFSLPNKLFEYLAAGLPVAVSNFPEMAPIVTRYKVGELFDPEDPTSIAEAINSILVDPRKYTIYQKNIEMAIEENHWGKEQERLLELYEGLVGAAKSRWRA